MLYDFDVSLRKLSQSVEDWSEKELEEGIAILLEKIKVDPYYKGRLEVLREEKMLRR